MRKTKIICTLGPASEDSEIIRQMIEAGTDVFRLNMSHAKHEWVRDIVPRVRALAQQLGRNVALLLDTQGPVDSHRRTGARPLARGRRCSGNHGAWRKKHGTEFDHGEL